MFHRVFRVQLRSLINTFQHGIIHHVSDSTEFAIIFFPEDESYKQVHLAWSDRFKHLKEVVTFVPGVQIHVSVVNEHIHTMDFLVNPDMIQDHVQYYAAALLCDAFKHSCSTHSLADLNVVQYLQCNEASFAYTFWNETMLLLPHQHKSVQFMQSVEEQLAHDAHLAYNSHITINEHCSLSRVDEAFTTDKQIQTFRVHGGYLCDEAGSGKTIVVLKHIAHRPRDQTGNLIIVPINIPNQWYQEIRRFYTDQCKIVCLWKASDLKNCTMQDIVDADIVLTTMSFIRTCKQYNDHLNMMIEHHFKGLTLRSKALFHTLRKVMHDKVSFPCLQLVKWHRIIVDEMHELKERDLRILKCFESTFLWGMTATPNFRTTDETNHINIFFDAIAPFHPNMYKTFVQECCHGHVRVVDTIPSNELHLVTLRDDEQERIQDQLNDEDCIMDVSTIDDRVTVCKSSQKLATLLLQPVHTVRLQVQRDILTLSKTLSIRCVCNCLIALKKNKQKYWPLIYDAILDKRDDILALNKMYIDATKQATFITQSMQKLKNETCPICLTNVCTVITRCGHLFCTNCIAIHTLSHETCPNCRQASSRADMFRILDEDETSKLKAIKNRVANIGQDENIVIFAQFKRVLKDLKTILNSDRVVHILGGNAAQRAHALSDFESTNGHVLLICASDTFAGIRLSHVRHVLFSHALLGEYHDVRSIEIQAIGRVMDISTEQQEVNVTSFVSADTREEYVFRRTHPMLG